MHITWVRSQHKANTSATALSGLVALRLANLRACLLAFYATWIRLPLNRRPIATCITVIIIRGNAYNSAKSCCKSPTWKLCRKWLNCLPRTRFERNSYSRPSVQHEKGKVTMSWTHPKIKNGNRSRWSWLLFVILWPVDCATIDGIQNPEGIFNRIMLRLPLLSYLLAVASQPFSLRVGDNTTLVWLFFYSGLSCEIYIRL